MAIILILTTLTLGPAMRVLQKVRADDWAEKAMADLQLTVTQLHAHFRGRVEFPEVTLEAIESIRLVQPTQLRFLVPSLGRWDFVPLLCELVANSRTATVRPARDAPMHRPRNRASRRDADGGDNPRNRRPIQPFFMSRGRGDTKVTRGNGH